MKIKFIFAIGIITVIVALIVTSLIYIKSESDTLASYVERRDADGLYIEFEKNLTFLSFLIDGDKLSSLQNKIYTVRQLGFTDETAADLYCDVKSLYISECPSVMNIF